MSAVMPTYARADVAFERGDGPYLYATDGRRFLDFAAGVAVNALGHGHPHLVQALAEQATKLWHCSNLYRIPGQERLAQRLVDATFADAVFFCNSGAEAVECGLKIVRRYQDAAGHPDRYRVVVCQSAFHGRTLATIAAGGQEKHLAGFDPMVEGFDRAAFGNLNEVRAAIGPETAAILVEPVQGEGGIRTGDLDFLKGLRAAADEFGLLLFFDEVQTGVGRTGKLFAHEWAGVTPDVMAVAKGLGGGFPVGACLAVDKAAKVMTAGSHGSTFGGNPLAMAVGNAVLDVVTEAGFMDGVNARGARLKEGLERLAAAHGTVFEEARGIGLMLGLKCRLENVKVVAALLADGLLTVPAGDNVVRLLPPLNIGDAQVDEALTILDRAAVRLAAEAKEKVA